MGILSHLNVPPYGATLSSKTAEQWRCFAAKGRMRELLDGRAKTQLVYDSVASEADGRTAINVIFANFYQSVREFARGIGDERRNPEDLGK